MAERLASGAPTGRQPLPTRRKRRESKTRPGAIFARQLPAWSSAYWGAQNSKGSGKTRRKKGRRRKRNSSQLDQKPAHFILMSFTLSSLLLTLLPLCYIASQPYVGATSATESSLRLANNTDIVRSIASSRPDRDSGSSSSCNQTASNTSSTTTGKITIVTPVTSYAVNRDQSGAPTSIAVQARGRVRGASSASVTKHSTTLNGRPEFVGLVRSGRELDDTSKSVNSNINNNNTAAAAVDEETDAEDELDEYQSWLKPGWPLDTSLRLHLDRLMSTLRLDDMISRSNEPFWPASWYASSPRRLADENPMPLSSSFLGHYPAGSASLPAKPELHEANRHQTSSKRDRANNISADKSNNTNGSASQARVLLSQLAASRRTKLRRQPERDQDYLTVLVKIKEEDEEISPARLVESDTPGAVSQAPFDNLTTIDPSGATIDTITGLELDPETGTPFGRWSTITIAVLIGLCVLLTVLGNILVLLSFVYERTIRQPSNYFICSLALSDLSIGVISMPLFAVYVLRGWRWTLGPFWCDLWLATDHTLCLVSIYTVLLITVDRFFSIKAPTRYREWRTKRKVIIMVIITWLVPFAIFFGTIMSWDWIQGKRDLKEYECAVQFLKKPLFNVTLIMFYFYSTLTIMFFLYAGIYKTARDLAKKSENKQKRMQLMMSMQQQQAEIFARYIGAGPAATAADASQTNPKGEHTATTGISRDEPDKFNTDKKSLEEDRIHPTGAGERSSARRDLVFNRSPSGTDIGSHALSNSRDDERRNTGHYRQNLTVGQMRSASGRQSPDLGKLEGKDKSKSISRDLDRERHLNAAQQLAQDSLCLGLGGADKSLQVHRNERKISDIEAASQYEMDRDSASRSSSPSFESDDDSPIGGTSSTGQANEQQQSKAIIAQLKQRHKMQSNSSPQKSRGLFSGRSGTSSAKKQPSPREQSQPVLSQKPRQQPLIPRSPIVSRNEFREFIINSNNTTITSGATATVTTNTSSIKDASSNSLRPFGLVKSCSSDAVQANPSSPGPVRELVVSRAIERGATSDSNKESYDSAISSSNNHANRSSAAETTRKLVTTKEAQDAKQDNSSTDVGRDSSLPLKCSCGHVLSGEELDELETSQASFSARQHRERHKQQQHQQSRSQKQQRKQQERKSLRKGQPGKSDNCLDRIQPEPPLVGRSSQSVSYTESIDSEASEGSLSDNKDSTVSASSLSSYSRHSNCDCCSLCSIQTDSIGAQQTSSSRPTSSRSVIKSGLSLPGGQVSSGGHLDATELQSRSLCQLDCRSSGAGPDVGDAGKLGSGQCASALASESAGGAPTGRGVACRHRSAYERQISKELKIGGLGGDKLAGQSELAEKISVSKPSNEASQCSNSAKLHGFSSGRTAHRRPSSSSSKLTSQAALAPLASGLDSSTCTSDKMAPETSSSWHDYSDMSRSTELVSGIGVTSLLASVGLRTVSQATAAAVNITLNSKPGRGAILAGRTGLNSGRGAKPTLTDPTPDRNSSSLKSNAPTTTTTTTTTTNSAAPQVASPTLVGAVGHNIGAEQSSGAANNELSFNLARPGATGNHGALVRTGAVMGKPRMGMRHKSKSENRARKALRTISFILGAFVLCWTPYHILALVAGFCTASDGCVNQHLFYFTYFLCYTNSPINPFCYALANAQFKRAFYRVLKCNFGSWQQKSLVK